jgi:hypothetical protein
MRIHVHIGPEQVGAARLQRVLADKRDQMTGKGVLYARAPGNRNHTKLFMAVTDPDHIDPLRHARGFGDPRAQEVLRDALVADLAAEVTRHQPQTLILSAEQLGTSLHRVSELERLRALLLPLSDDIRIVAHVDDPARLLARAYAGQVMEGRALPLARELEMAKGDDWWRQSLDAAPVIDPARGQFVETQAPPFWIDFTALQAFWEGVFGAGSVTLRPYDAALFHSDTATAELRDAFGIDDTIGKAEPADQPTPPSAAWLTRARLMNGLLLRLLERGDRVLTRPVWQGILSEIGIDGPPLNPGSLAPLSDRFAADWQALIAAHPALATLESRPDPAALWSEADPERGFRASQYLLAFMHKIDKVTREAGPDPKAAANADPGGLSDTARTLMPPLAVQNFERLRGSPFAPHNGIGAVNEEDLAADYPPMPARVLAPGSSGNVIVGCMKNEAPYIVEWVAYHRAMGVDNFLIYTNGCEDGTDEILDRLQEMGVLQHRLNDDWKGNSPQQYALNRSLKEPVIENADWIIHIDVDEFINVRCGNGTLDDFFARAPDATNVAMTWRMFGHNDVRALSDDFVIDQFDACAPKFCPKPHTVWGFKTMFRNIGAYAKISCHRPNKLAEDFRDKVKWVNGSGQDMTREVAENGWRNSKKTIGYDLLQLNHYALRSAESFMIKRQRGRALHVDRSIGLNYWIRMDWCDHRDITIKRNLPRLRAEYDRLMKDDILRDWHHRGLDWHRAKAIDLHGQPEFEELYQQALEVKLTGTERVAYALALDMES